MRHLVNFLAIFIFSCVSVFSQNIKTIDASKVNTNGIEKDHLKMGNPGPEGKKLEVNNRYLTLDGKPILPVMGEVHYSRIPRDQWEDVLLKMKAAGINIVASYVIWIHHEEIEGQFDWTGNKDVRAFAKLCAKHGLWFYPRIGPWAHAEVRNGGMPDWILLKENLKDRRDDPLYLSYADKWYKAIAGQLQGLMYKDGGPIIGIQLENEYRRGPGGESHILWLKETAQNYGFDVPMYTVTGWGNASVPRYEVLPLYGGYPDAPWATNIERSTTCEEYNFKAFRNSDGIGSESGRTSGPYVDPNDYPYFTCEVGVGIMNTDHRRLYVDPKDGLGIIVSKIASGSNLPGYYMFAGGSNPEGIMSTMEENKDETGYWNTNPVISYDFQAAVRESGRLNGSYFEVRKLHYFLNEFGDRVAPKPAVFPEEQSELQYVVRADENSAYLFGSNYCRHNKKTPLTDVQFEVKLASETVKFPSDPITIADSAIFIWPVNFQMEDINLKYATAQPLCRVGTTWIFIEDAVAVPEFCFNSENIKNVKTTSGNAQLVDDKAVFSNLSPGKDCELMIETDHGTQKILVLSKEDALNSWLLDTKAGKQFYVTASGMYADQEKVYVFGTEPVVDVYQLKSLNNISDTFIHKQLKKDKKEISVEFKQVGPLDDAAWLKTAVDKISSKNELYHRFFTKEFELQNTSDVKQAQLLIYGESDFRIQVNNRWVTQSVDVSKLNAIDLTGYVQKGENRIVLDFPFEDGEKAFAAQLQVEFRNSNRTTILTDTTWLQKDAYNYPTRLSGFGGFKAIELADKRIGIRSENTLDKKYQVRISENYLDGLKNVYLQIDYSGDKGKIYYGGKRVADNFFNGEVWETGLNRLPIISDRQMLQLEITALKPEAKVYFDFKDAKSKALVGEAIGIKAIPEYQYSWDVE